MFSKIYGYWGATFEHFVKFILLIFFPLYELSYDYRIVKELVVYNCDISQHTWWSHNKLFAKTPLNMCSVEIQLYYLIQENIELNNNGRN